MRTTKTLSLLLSLALAVTPLTACADKATTDVGSEDEMTRELSETVAIEVPFNEAGTYEVSFTEANLVEMDTEDEMGRELSASEQGEGDSQSGEASASDGTADEADAASLAESDGSELSEDGAQPSVKPGLSFADVTMDDVRVIYQQPLNEGMLSEEAPYEEREIPTTAFSNDGKTITLTFDTSGAGDEGYVPSSFAIVIDGLAAQALVWVRHPEPEVVTVDYDAQLDAIEYATDFSEDDIALPEGVEVVGGTAVVTDEAEAAVADALADDPSVETELSRGDMWGAGDVVAKYAPDALGYVSDDARKVGEYGAAIYNVVKSGAKLDIAGLYNSGRSLLQMMGIVDKDDPAQPVTNEQLLEELKELRQDVADLRLLTTNMSMQLDKALQEEYAIHLQSFDNALGALNVNASVATAMFQSGATLAQERGIKPPATGASADEQFEYNRQLKELMVTEEKAGNEQFASFSSHMEDLRKNFQIVATEVKKTGTLNPISAYDSYWDMHFNWQSEGWYLRQAYRSNIEYQLKGSYALLALYYNIGSPKVGSTYDAYTDLVSDSLAQLEAMPAGVSPTDVTNGLTDKNGQDPRTGKYYHPSVRLSTPVYSPTFGKSLSFVKDYGDACDYNPYNAASTFDASVLRKYVEKLHGMTPEEDLRLAGIWFDGIEETMWKGSGEWGEICAKTHGIGINFRSTGYNSGQCDLLSWAGTRSLGNNTWEIIKGGHKVYEKVPTKKNWATLTNAYGDVSTQQITALYLGWA